VTSARSFAHGSPTSLAVVLANAVGGVTGGGGGGGDSPASGPPVPSSPTRRLGSTNPPVPTTSATPPATNTHQIQLSVLLPMLGVLAAAGVVGCSDVGAGAVGVDGVVVEVEAPVTRMGAPVTYVELFELANGVIMSPLGQGIVPFKVNMPDITGVVNTHSSAFPAGPPLGAVVLPGHVRPASFDCRYEGTSIP